VDWESVTNPQMGFDSRGPVEVRKQSPIKHRSVRSSQTAVKTVLRSWQAMLTSVLNIFCKFHPVWCGWIPDHQTKGGGGYPFCICHWPPVPKHWKQAKEQTSTLGQHWASVFKQEATLL